MEKLGVIFNQVATPLQYTPRKLAVHPPTGNLVIVETDHAAFSEATKAHRKQQMAEVGLTYEGVVSQLDPARNKKTSLDNHLVIWKLRSYLVIPINNTL